MILAAAAGIGVSTALWSFTRIKRIAQLQLRHIWLVWLAFTVQLVLFQWVAPHLTEQIVKGTHLFTYAVLVVFIALNRHLPGGWIIALGTGCNLTAIAANGGTMPASLSALDRAGFHDIPSEVIKNSAYLSDPKLLFLGDVFAVPEGWPLANVFSIGDVLIVIGGTYLAHRWCSQPHDADVVEAPASDDLVAAGV